MGAVRKTFETQTEPHYLLNLTLHPLAVDFAPSENHFEADIKDWRHVEQIVSELFAKASTPKQSKQMAYPSEDILPNTKKERHLPKEGVHSIPKLAKDIIKVINLFNPTPVKFNLCCLQGWHDNKPKSSLYQMPAQQIVIQADFKLNLELLQKMEIIGQVDCKFISKSFRLYMPSDLLSYQSWIFTFCH